MNLRPFELALVVIFIVLMAFSLLFLSAFSGRSGNDNNGLPIVGQVVIWGTLPSSVVRPILEAKAEINESYKGVSYREVSVKDFNSELINALADRRGPDLVLTSHEQLVELRPRIRAISYDSFPKRDIQDRYVDGAQIFALNDGLYAYPIAVDPMMMYWNRNILTNEGFLVPPPTWESLVNTYFPALIQRDFSRTIQRGVIAMGEYDNINNSFGILSTLLLQGGSQGVTESNGEYFIKLNSSAKGSGEPLRTAVDFYTRFSMPSNTLYSWNRSFDDDRSEFVSEDLVFYFGFGSEALEIERLNPNLNFDIAEVPQGETATIRRTYGKFYGLSLLASSDNAAGAGVVLQELAQQSIADNIAKGSGLVPVFRSTVSAGSNDSYGRFTYKATTIAYGWLNPSISATDTIFSTMTRDINESRQTLAGAVKDALDRLQLEYN